MLNNGVVRRLDILFHKQHIIQEERQLMFDTLRDLICEELGVEAEQVTMETDFVTDLHCDSLELIELTNVVEEEYELEEIPEEERVTLKTVGDLFRYIEANVTEA